MKHGLLKKDVPIGAPNLTECYLIIKEGLNETNCFFRKGKQLFVITDMKTSSRGKPHYNARCIDHDFK